MDITKHLIYLNRGVLGLFKVTDPVEICTCTMGLFGPLLYLFYHDHMLVYRNRDDFHDHSLFTKKRKEKKRRGIGKMFHEGLFEYSSRIFLKDSDLLVHPTTSSQGLSKSQPPNL